MFIPGMSMIRKVTRRFAMNVAMNSLFVIGMRLRLGPWSKAVNVLGARLFVLACLNLNMELGVQNVARLN